MKWKDAEGDRVIFLWVWLLVGCPFSDGMRGRRGRWGRRERKKLGGAGDWKEGADGWKW